MQTNSKVEFNLGMFNVPTIVGILTIIGLLINMTNNRTEMDAKVSSKLESLDKDVANINGRLSVFDTQISTLPNLTYRITNSEAANNAVNARVDRQTDAIGQLNVGIAGVSSDLRVLTQRLEMSIPLKKSELVIPMPTPMEFK